MYIYIYQSHGSCGNRCLQKHIVSRCIFSSYLGVYPILFLWVLDWNEFRCGHVMKWLQRQNKPFLVWSKNTPKSIHFSFPWPDMARLRQKNTKKNIKYHRKWPPSQTKILPQISNLLWEISNQIWQGKPENPREILGQENGGQRLPIVIGQLQGLVLGHGSITKLLLLRLPSLKLT